MTSTPHRPHPLQAIDGEAFPGEAAAPLDDRSSEIDTSWLIAEDDEPVETGAGGRAVLGWALALLGLAWVGFAGWSAGTALGQGAPDAPAIAQWLAVAAGPLALLGLAWLVFGRTRRREAEAFSRSVAVMQQEARSLEGLLAVLRRRIDDNHVALRAMADQLMTLGDEATARLGSAAAGFDDSARRLAAHGQTFDQAAQSARIDLGVLLDDLPRAETIARSMAGELRAAGGSAIDQAARFEAQVASLTGAASEADRAASEAAARLTQRLADLEHQGIAVTERLGAATTMAGESIDLLMQRTSEALDTARNAIDAQAEAVLALVDQAKGGIDQAGAVAAERLRATLADASASLESIAQRVAAQDDAARRLASGMTSDLAAFETRFAAFAETGDQRAAGLRGALGEVRATLEAIEDQSGRNQGAVNELAGRLAAMRETLALVSQSIGADVAVALDGAEAGAARLLEASNAARPVIEQARDAALEAGARLEGGAGAIEAQHDRLAALLAAVDTGVGGAERRLGELGQALAEAEAEAGRLTGETAPALVAALVQVKETAAHAAARAREAIADVIPASATQLSGAARDALEKAVREAVTDQLAAVERAAVDAVAAAESASQRLTRQMLSIGQSAAALEAHRAATEAAERERGGETFARRVALLMESMHSAAIDVGKILSDEVDDKAWASYLKGDRGVFTRRAARLLATADERALAAHYGSDQEFRESVNRYVADFEAMLRRVTTERDGGAMAVTLMSSDLGKLYAALSALTAARG
jgi:hypothetical protein